MKSIDTFWCALDLNLDCNRNCSFCCKKGETGSIYNSIRLQEAVETIRPTILKYKAKNICIPILGGEPLLHPELPIETLERFQALPVIVDIWMYTNGDFLTDAVMQEYKAKRIWITLSTAESPLEELWDKIKFLKRYYRTPRLSITLSRANLERLEDIITKSLEMQFTMRFRHQYYDEPGFHYDVPRLSELYEEIVPTQFSRYVKGPHITLNNLMFTYEDAIPGWNEMRSPYICGRSFFHFSADGKIRSCSGSTDNNVIGEVGEEIQDLVANLKKAVDSGRSGRWSAQKIKECQGCPVYGACQGGCPLTRKLAFGSFNKPTPYCTGIKKTMKIFLETCYEKANTKPRR